MFGYSRAEMKGQKIELLIPDRFRADHPHYRREYVQNPTVRSMGHGRELFALRKDGTEFPCEIGLSPIEADSLLVIASIGELFRHTRKGATCSIDTKTLREKRQALV